MRVFKVFTFLTVFIRLVKTSKPKLTAAVNSACKTLNLTDTPNVVKRRKLLLQNLKNRNWESGGWNQSHGLSTSKKNLDISSVIT